MVSIEPDPTHFDNLSKLRNKYFDFGVTKNVAVSNKAGTFKFFRSNNNSAMNSLLNVKESGHDIEEIYVETITINDLISEFGEFDYVKIDIEGGEENLICALNEESAKKISNIHIEYHPDSFGISCKNIIRHLEKLNYDVITYHDIIYAKAKNISI